MPSKIVLPESAGMSSLRLQRINSVMQEQIEQGNFSGISTLVARRGKLVHFNQFGCRDREAGTPMQADTIFRLYSMTKPIICTALMILYEEGKFHLREPVSKFIPAFANLKVLEIDQNGNEHLVDLEQPVTIHHLLTHTSGLVYDFYEDNPVCQLYREQQIVAAVKDVSLEDFVDKLCQLPLGFQPGAQWYYSVSIDVIARLVEIIADKPLDTFLHERIFSPLGMNDIAFCLPEDKRHRLATMYGGVDLCAPDVTLSHWLDAWEKGINKRLDVSTTAPVDDTSFLRGGIGLNSTAEDYFHFAQMLLNKGQLDSTRILGPRTVDFMFINHLDLKLLPIGFPQYKLLGYGFGLGSRVLVDVAQSQSLSSAGEYGWSGAARTYYWIDPKEELIGLFMAQYIGNFSLITANFQTLVYQALLE